MWIKENQKQKILLIDPKGLTHMSFDPQEDESKINLHEHLKKEIQPNLNNQDIKLDAYTDIAYIRCAHVGFLGCEGVIGYLGVQ